MASSSSSHSLPDSTIGVGSLVRVRWKEETCRATVSFVEDGPTYDVLLEPDLFHDFVSDGDEICGLTLAQLQPLTPFEHTLYGWREQKVRKIGDDEDTGRTDNRASSTTLDQFFDRAWLGFVEAAAAYENDPFVCSLSVAATLKERGNELFKLKDYTAAFECYSIAIRGLQRSKTTSNSFLVPTDNDPELGRVLQLVTRSQLPSAHVQENAPTRGLRVYDRVLQGALYTNRSRCLSALQDQLSAIQDLSVVVGLFGTPMEDVWAGSGVEQRPPSGLVAVLTEEDRVEKLAKGLFLRSKAKLARKVGCCCVGEWFVVS